MHHRVANPQSGMATTVDFNFPHSVWLQMMAGPHSVWLQMLAGPHSVWLQMLAGPHSGCEMARIWHAVACCCCITVAFVSPRLADITSR